MNQLSTQTKINLLLVGLALSISLFFKLSLIGIGAPYTTIDDNTLFNAGFLVWFGKAPPQRMYLESWLVGATSIATYIYHLIASGQTSQLGINIVADAFRDFQHNPRDYVLHYRYLMLCIDLLTAFFIYRLTNLVFIKERKTWLAILPACLYLLSSNTLWCNLVARPDTVTALFSVIGVYAYLLSQQGNRTTPFYIGAIFLGCATGFKLHAAFFVIAIIIDLIRVHGFSVPLNRIATFVFISVFLFCVVAGSPLFDPLLYIKLRALNMIDDASPWIHQGDQLLVLLRASGWIAVPLLLAAIVLIIKQWRTTSNQNLKSLMIIAGLFLLLFCSLRVLRGYWMLPALPLFYISATYTLSQLRNIIPKIILASVMCSLLAFQTFQQYQYFNNARYNELQTWVKANIKTDDTIYILGFDTLFLPQSTLNLQNKKRVLTNGLERAISNGESFTLRHVRLWEERAALMLIDMLNTKSTTGYNYYSLNSTPIEDLTNIVSYNDIDYMFVMKGISDTETNGLLSRTQQDFVKLTEVNSPGGKNGTDGLTYEIYERNNHVR